MSRLGDPLVLFLVLGAALAGLHALTREEPPRLQRATEVVVTEADVAWLERTFRKTWQRPPTPEERRTLVERRVRDEILFREARALGLDEGDEALRRRLAQKLEFVVKDATAVEPDEAELEAWHAANGARYAQPAARSFVHVYLSEDKRGAQARADAEALLAKLKAKPEQEVAELGDRIMLEPEQRGLTPRDTRALFGDGFAEALFAQPLRQWGGPLRSGYGLHLVYVRSEQPGVTPPLEAVRERVRADVLDERRDRALEAYLEALRSKYDVRIEAPGFEGLGSEGSGR